MCVAAVAVAVLASTAHGRKADDSSLSQHLLRSSGTDEAKAGGKTAGDYEACAGCKFVWEKTHSLLDESAGYEAAKDAFERTCANVPDVFFDACDSMFDQEDAFIQDYLSGTGFSGMCSAAKLC